MLTGVGGFDFALQTDQQMQFVAMMYDEMFHDLLFFKE
jgi:hypothetical protein